MTFFTLKNKYNMYMMLSEIFYVLCNISCVRDLRVPYHPPTGGERSWMGENRGVHPSMARRAGVFVAFY